MTRFQPIHVQRDEYRSEGIPLFNSRAGLKLLHDESQSLEKIGGLMEEVGERRRERGGDL